MPDFIITTGDNNYPLGEAETIDHRIGQFYQEYIYPYRGLYGSGAEANRFFPALGNHDMDTDGGQPFLAYFTLPGNERYYDFTWGPVHLYAINTDWREPDGVTTTSVQAQWLQNQLALSNAPWKIVYGHLSPFSSGQQGSNAWMAWPFQEWGATAFLAGHDHVYERIVVDGFPYFVNGLGGGGRYFFGPPVPGSQARFNGAYGALQVEATPRQLTFQFITVGGEVIDTYQINR